MAAGVSKMEQKISESLPASQAWQLELDEVKVSIGTQQETVSDLESSIKLQNHKVSKRNYFVFFFLSSH